MIQFPSHLSSLLIPGYNKPYCEQFQLFITFIVVQCTVAFYFLSHVSNVVAVFGLSSVLIPYLIKFYHFMLFSALLLIEYHSCFEVFIFQCVMYIICVKVNHWNVMYSNI